MKKGPQLRFPDLKGTWQEHRIKDVTDYVDYRGKTPQKTESGVFLVTAKNIKKGFIDYEASKEYISKEDYDSVMSRGIPMIGDVLFTTEAPLGNIAQIDKEDIALAQRVIKFRGNEQLNNTFLKYVFLSETFNNTLKSKSIGSTVKGIQGKVLHNMLISIPEMNEQQKIADFFTLLDQKIEKQQQKVERLKQYEKGIMQQLFSRTVRFKDDIGNDYPEWEVDTMGNLSDIGTGANDLQDRKEDGEYPFFVRSSKVERIDKYTFNGEAILVPGDGNIGQIYHYFCGKFAYHQRVYKISDFDSRVIGKYVYYYLKEFFLREALKNSVKATVDSLRLPTLTSFKISFPLLHEQEKIVDFLSFLDRKKEKEEQKLQLLLKQKKGMMQKMFV